MSSPFLTTLLLAAVSAALMGLGCLVRPLKRVCGVLCIVWFAAALPLLFFLNVPSQLVLLFYLISAAAGLLFNIGGRRA